MYISKRKQIYPIFRFLDIIVRWNSTFCMVLYFHNLYFNKKYGYTCWRGEGQFKMWIKSVFSEWTAWFNVVYQQFKAMYDSTWLSDLL